ncbi:MAG: general secretion pathway protein GspK [Deltaproteobacteria bacterium]|nr:general secretion pathway protein GspK [Deltaproteobacteria bacterium]
MTRALRAVWWELTRPRGRRTHRFYRGARRSRSGVALVMVLTTILFMTVLVTEISYAALVRVQLASQERNEVKAEALAMTGLNLYRLILIASKQLGSNSMIGDMAASFGVSIGDTLWQMVPAINTGLLRMLLVFDDGLDEDDVADVEQAGGLSEEQLAETRESKGSERNFLDFDGDFFAEVHDEDRKIAITGIKATSYADLMTDPVALKLYSLMSGVRTCGNTKPFATPTNEIDDQDQFFYEQNLDRWELIANLADWNDSDSDRLYQGGAEESLYQRLQDPYMPKNAPFDTLQEVRLVDGWHRDDVWERYGDKITVYGGGKVNVNTAQCEVMWALVKAYYPSAPDPQIEEIIRYIEEYRAMSTFASDKAFVNYLTQAYPTVDANIKNSVSTQSTIFRVLSTGQVGEAAVKVEVVLDFTSSDLGKVVYWRVE